jgi:hypothetical protein
VCSLQSPCPSCLWPIEFPPLPVRGAAFYLVKRAIGVDRGNCPRVSASQPEKRHLLPVPEDSWLRLSGVASLTGLCEPQHLIYLSAAIGSETSTIQLPLLQPFNLESAYITSAFYTAATYDHHCLPQPQPPPPPPYNYNYCRSISIDHLITCLSPFLT